jgi:hypothetical protein
MGRTRELASAFVRLFVKKDELSAGLNSAKAEVGQATEQMAQSAGKVSTGFGGVAASIKSATKPARDLVGSITSTLGIFTRILGIVGLIGTAVGGIVAAWKAINEYGEKQAASLQTALDRQRELSNLARSATPSNKADVLAKIQAETNVNKLYVDRAALQDKINKFSAADTQIAKVTLADAQKRLASVNEQIRAEEARVTLLQRASEEYAKQEEAVKALKQLQNFEQLVRDESAKAEKDAADEALRKREEQIEAARDAAREILDAAREEQEILEESAKIRERIHREEMRRIEERAAAELRAINDARNQTLSAINAAQNALGQNNLAVAHLARIDRLVRMILERPIEKRL